MSPHLFYFLLSQGTLFAALVLFLCLSTPRQRNPRGQKSQSRR